MDITLLIPRLLLIYMVPGLLPALVILSASANKLQSVGLGTVVFIFFALDIFLSILLENIRFSFFQNLSLVENRFFSKNLLKFFSLVKNNEVFPLSEVWRDYRNKEQAAIKLWLIANIEKSGG